MLVIGGGIAGITCALRLAKGGAQVHLWEAKANLGGRAASYYDSASGETVDHCQHVSMGCCVNLTRLCSELDSKPLFRWDYRLTFIAPNNVRHAFGAFPFAPAPLHLAPSLMGFSWLSLGEKMRIATAMLQLARMKSNDPSSQQTMLQWLQSRGQSRKLQDGFWSVVLVSALGDTIDRVSVAAARKVFVDGFMSHRRNYQVLAPLRPLAEIFDTQARLAMHKTHITVETSRACRSMDYDVDANLITKVDNGHTSGEHFQAVVLAVPWRKAASLFPAAAKNVVMAYLDFAQLQSSPITGIHLWYDRPITSLPHAAFVGKLAQWLFRDARYDAAKDEHYHQVVISASRNIVKSNKSELVARIDSELKQAFPESKDCVLLRSKVINEHEAVFTAAPHAPRPKQQTPIHNLFLAGDWTDTGWPATMEGAVISGELAAGEVARYLGLREIPQPKKAPRGWLAKWLIREG